MSLPDPAPRITGRPEGDRPVTGGAALATTRERVIALLTDRFADDALTADEFQAWLDRLRDATTAWELDAMLYDLARLPAGPPVSAPAYPAPWQGRPPAVESVTAIMGDTTRTGPYALTTELEARVILGTVLLDLREAALPPGGCEIAVTGVLGQLSVLVPPGVVVEDGVTPVMSTVRNAAEHGVQHSRSAPRLRLTGTAVMSEIEVRVGQPGEPAKRAWKEAKPRRARR